MCAYLRWNGDGLLHFGHIRGRVIDRSDVNLADCEKGKAKIEVFMTATCCSFTLVSAEYILP